MDGSSQTRDDLEQAFWKLYPEKGIEHISIRELTQVAGYNRATFYLHYDDIYDMLARIEDDLLDQLADCIAAHPIEGGGAKALPLMSAMLDFYHRNKDHLVALLGDKGDTAFARKLKDQMKRIPIWKVQGAIEEPSDDRAAKRSARRSAAQSKRQSSTRQDPLAGERDLLLEQTVSGVLALITSWMADSRGVSAYRLLHLIYDTAIKG